AMIYDWRTQRRWYPVYLYGIVLTILPNAVAVVIAPTRPWLAIAAFLEHLGGWRRGGAPARPPRRGPADGASCHAVDDRIPADISANRIPSRHDPLSAPHASRLRLTVAIGLPCFPRYSKTTTTP